MKKVKSLQLAITLFSASALIDNTMTYLYVKVWQVFAETNPLVAFFLDRPLLWILYELTVLLFSSVASFMYKQLLESLVARTSTSKPSAVAVKLLELAKKIWILPVWTAAVTRFTPVVHNVLLVFFGIETPLPEFFNKAFFSLFYL